MVRIRALHDPPQTGFERSRLVLLGDLTDQPTSRQSTASGGRVVGALQMHACSIRQLSERLQGVEGRFQKRRVVTIGRGCDGPKRDASGVHHHRAFDGSLRPCPPGFFPLSAHRLLCLGDAAVHRQIGQLQPDETIVGIEGDLPEILHQPEFDPLIMPATQRALTSEQDLSAILSYAQPNTRIWTSFPKTTLSGMRRG